MILKERPHKAAHQRLYGRETAGSSVAPLVPTGSIRTFTPELSRLKCSSFAERRNNSCVCDGTGFFRGA